jgi:hypothetical protein
VWEQNTGEVYVVDGHGNTVWQARGWSGFREAINDSSRANEENVGPLPEGSFAVEYPWSHGENWRERRGPNQNRQAPAPDSIHLVPDKETADEIRRDGRRPDTFFIHGEKRDDAAGSSQGCGILRPHERRQLMDAMRVVGAQRLMVLKAGSLL